jgi:hypothetical protein
MNSTHPDASLTLRQAFDKHYKTEYLRVCSVRQMEYAIAAWEPLTDLAEPHENNPLRDSASSAAFPTCGRARFPSGFPTGLLWRTWTASTSAPHKHDSRHGWVMSRPCSGVQSWCCATSLAYARPTLSASDQETFPWNGGS